MLGIDFYAFVVLLGDMRGPLGDLVGARWAKAMLMFVILCLFMGFIRLLRTWRMVPCPPLALG